MISFVFVSETNPIFPNYGNSNEPFEILRLSLQVIPKNMIKFKSGTV